MQKRQNSSIHTNSILGHVLCLICHWASLYDYLRAHSSYARVISNQYFILLFFTAYRSLFLLFSLARFICSKCQAARCHLSYAIFVRISSLLHTVINNANQPWFCSPFSHMPFAFYNIFSSRVSLFTFFSIRAASSPLSLLVLIVARSFLLFCACDAPPRATSNARPSSFASQSKPTANLKAAISRSLGRARLRAYAELRCNTWR